MEAAQQFFSDFSGSSDLPLTALPQSGSSRINYIAENHSGKFILTSNAYVRENDAFIYLSNIFSEENLNTPKVLAVSEDRKMYLQEFVGGHTLSEIIQQEGTSERTINLVTQTLDRLYTLQEKVNGKVDYSLAFEYEKYDELPVLNDVFYFKNMFVDVLEISYHKSSLIREFKRVAEKIESLSPTGIMLRDFQARNIMVDYADNVYFIDYQSAMRGPRTYDAVSFLYQAKANFPEDFKEEMLSYFINKFPINQQENLRKSIPLLLLVRYLQVLGAYGFRGLVQHKPHFISSIPKGIENLTLLMQKDEFKNNYPTIFEITRQFSCADIQRKIQQFSIL